MNAIPFEPCRGSAAIALQRPPVPCSLRAALVDGARGVLAVLRCWQRRWRGRRELAALDDRMLADIGLTRGDVALLINKPFWKE